MKGIIFNLAEEVIATAHGEQAWDEILDASGLDGAYTSLGSYPDEDLVTLVQAAASQLGVSGNDVLRALGEGAMPLLVERFASFFTGHDSTRPFLLTLNDIIHTEVRKLYPGALVPDFGFETVGDDGLVIRYESARKLCALAEGFILGAAHHYEEQVAIDQPECMHKGADRCLLHCTFSPTTA